MPKPSTVKEFERALKTRQVNITKALDKLFAAPSRHQTHPRFADLKKAGALNRPMPAWARRELRGLGLSPREIAHINSWPDAQKERVRKALVTAIENNRKVRFFWELHGGNNEATDVPDPLPATGALTITFRSPQSRVRVSSALTTFGQISVGVGR